MWRLNLAMPWKYELIADDLELGIRECPKMLSNSKHIYIQGGFQRETSTYPGEIIRFDAINRRIK